MSVLVLSESENEGEQLMEDLADDVAVENVVDSRLADERANVPVSVVTERFLRAILDKVPLDRVEELHLFSPLRQGTVETGIAVIAARVIVVDEVVPQQALELQLDREADTAGQTSDAVEDVESMLDASELVESDVEISDDSSDDGDLNQDDVTADDVKADNVNADVVGEEIEIAVDDSAELDVDGAEDLSDDEIDNELEVRAEHDDSPYADEPVQLKLVRSSDVSDDDEAVIAKAPKIFAEEVPETPRVRHTVYTARYRLIVKGPERGRWEIDVVDEADAPLLTVETVVRGVQRRAGEETATVRYDAAQLARALRMPIPG